MKSIWFVVAAAIGLLVSDLKAQDTGTYITREGKTHFFSAAPLEDIEATSLKSTCVINTQNNTLVAKIPITSFQFESGLMQEHFNENYMESEKYPNSTLKAKIVNAPDYTKDGVFDVVLKGTFEIHGVVKEREINGTITVKDGAPVRGQATFFVKLADHKIKIPKAVFSNIAENIKVDVDYVFEKYVKN